MGKKNFSTQRIYTYTYIIRTVIPLGRKYSEILCTVNGNSKPDHYKAWERKTSQLKEYIHIHIQFVLLFPSEENMVKYFVLSIKDPILTFTNRGKEFMQSHNASIYLITLLTSFIK